MELRAQRRIAAAIMKTGRNNIWIDPDFAYDVSLALTRDDIRKLIYDRVIQSRPMKGVSRARARVRASEKKRGQHRGQYRELYAKSKGGAFRSLSHLRHTITELGWLKKKKKRVRL
jgi:large subunit ribosomal protein L19e